MTRIDTTSLTPAQLAGVTCVVCDTEDGAMIPVDVVDGGQVFAHPMCVTEDAAPAPQGVLVVGPMAGPADVKALRALAYNIAYELGRPATWATHTDHTVTDYAAVYLTGDVASLRDASTLVLVGEALAAGIDVHDPLATDEATECPCGLVSRHTRPDVDEDGEVVCAECRGESGCTWCGEWNDTEDLTIVEDGTMWVPMHAGCHAGVHRSTLTSPLPLAA